MSEEKFYGFMIIVAFGVILMTIGYISSRNLPKKQKLTRNRKFACAAVIPFAFYLFFTAPYVGSSSRTDTPFFKDQPIEGEFQTIKEVTSHAKDQLQNIQLLKKEVERLRRDLDAVNDHFRLILQILAIASLSLCGSYIISKSEDESEEN